MKEECSVQNNCAVCKTAKKNQAWERTKREQENLSCLSCLFIDFRPLEITGKKTQLILCNFTFMFFHFLAICSVGLFW